MGNYTDFFDKKTKSIVDEDDYIDELKRIVGKFRTFGETMDSFIMEHGYNGELNDVDGKVKFISEKCKQAGVPVRRNVKKWFTEEKRVERISKVPFQLCFAFQLSVDEANDFLRRICLSRGFDCHSVEEVVYYFAMKTGLTYSDAQDILSNVSEVKSGKIQDEELIYTDFIVEEIDEIETSDELIKYLNDNVCKFSYNNATAYEAIRTIWEDIAGDEKEEGIAIRESRKIYPAFDEEYTSLEIYGSGKKKSEKETGREKEIKVRSRDDDSRWEIYLQILGLSGKSAASLYKSRSLKSILRDEKLLHPLAEDSFPDRDGINKILNGEHVSHERVRKLLILLVFYKFYAIRALRNNRYIVPEEDGDRCVSAINANLVSANYPVLYAGNPYDFLILMSIRMDAPLQTFREFMRELFRDSILQ